MDIKSWILLVGTALIVAVVCHGFWTAYRSRRSDMRMEIEADIPQGDLDEMVLLRGELPNGGARVTPTVGYESLRVKDRPVFTQGAVSSSITSRTDLLDLPPDEVAEFAEEETLRAASAQQKHSPDESNPDAGYEPEQVTLDLTLDGLEENHAARLAAAGPSGNDSDRPADEQSATTALLSSAAGGKKAPLLLDAANTPLGVHSAEMSASQPQKKLIAPKDQPPPRKQFEPPLPGEGEIQKQAQLRAQNEAAAAEHAKAQKISEELAFAAEKDRLAQEQAEVERLERDKRIRAAARKTIEAPEQPQLAFAQDEPTRQSKGRMAEPGPVSGGEELVVLNVISKTSVFHGGDVLELFLRNGIKFGDMNIFHRIDPVTKASQYSIASLTEPGYFDLRTMDALQIKGLCLFMQLPGPGQPTKVFTDMLTVADKLARQLDAEVCDEQFNRLTRQSTEHYRQRVAEFTRRQMARRALV